MPGRISLPYLLLCAAVLLLPLALSFEPGIPGWIVNVAMILALLSTSRLFYAKFARVMWYIGLSMNGVGLILAAIPFVFH